MTENIQFYTGLNILNQKGLNKIMIALKVTENISLFDLFCLVVELHREGMLATGRHRQVH